MEFQENYVMVRNSSNPSPSSTKHSKSKSKSKSKQPQKSSNPSSTYPASKQPQSSLKPVSSQVRNHQVKPHYEWIRKDSSKPSSSSSNRPPTINPTQFPAPSNIPNQQTKGKNLCVKEGSSYLIPPSSPLASSSSNGPLSPSGLLPSYPKLHPKLREIQSSEPDENEEQKKKNYGLIEKDSLPIYRIPKRIRVLIEKDIVPKVLHEPLSPSSYRDYFSALLYAEEFYLVKWRDFEMRGVEMQLQKASVYNRRRKKDDRLFAVFEIDSVPERRPYLLSRDIVYARPSGRNVEPFEGILHKVAKSIHVLVDFDNDFHFQHHASRRYDISFSFNRICLKRAHHALKAASNPMLRSLYLFPASLCGKAILTKPLPSENNKLEPEQLSAVDKILSLEGPSPYLVEGQLCVSNANRSSSKLRKLSRTGEIVRESVIRIYQRSPQLRILICSPFNGTCDELMMRLQEVIPEYNMFRANAAFRELEAVPSDILPSCPYDGECFTCPSLDVLNRFRVIFSTFVTCFRLHREGIACGHFSHIFLVDTSAATEPETMIALANFADENTTVVITGSPTNSPYQVRSDIARRKGLNISYFERLRKESSGD